MDTLEAFDTIWTVHKDDNRKEEGHSTSEEDNNMMDEDYNMIDEYTTRRKRMTT